MVCFYSFSNFTKQWVFTLLFCFTSLALAAQTGAIKGTIRTSDGTAAAYVNITLKELPTKGGISEQNGNYIIKNIQPGTYTVVISRVGLEPQ